MANALPDLKLLRIFASVVRHQGFASAVSLDPKSPGALFAAGSLSWAMKDLPHADHDLKLAADFSPPRSPQRLGYANFKLKTGDVRAGTQMLTAMTKQTPDYLPAWGSLAEVALMHTNFDECTRLLNQIQARDPENYQAQMLHALELIDYAIQHLARYEVPSRIAFVSELPKTTVGKVLRRELVQLELAALQKAGEPVAQS